MRFWKREILWRKENVRLTGEGKKLYQLQDLYHHEFEAWSFSDGKYNITNDFGGTLYEYIGKDTAIDLMRYVDEINVEYGGKGTKMYSTAGSKFKKLCLQNKLKLLEASVRHLGTDINYVVLENLYAELKDKVEFRFNYYVDKLEKTENGYIVTHGEDRDECEKCIVSVGRSGSKWMEEVCRDMKIPTKSNRVDLGGRRIIQKKMRPIQARFHCGYVSHDTQPRQ